MATIVLQYAGAALGGLIGGPLGAIAGRALGAIGGSVIDQLLFAPAARRTQGPRLADLRVMSSSEGAPIPRLWGRMRLAGQVIWATNFEEEISTQTEKASAKGVGGAKTKTEQYLYHANVAVAIAEGPVARVNRAWADGKPFDLASVTWRFYSGGEEQDPDSLIIAKEGADNAPAYRGVSYIVFERLPLERFGNRLPQLTFEAVRPLGGMADHMRAVNIIPGSTEFGYDPDPVTREAGEGVTEPENTHFSAFRSNWTMSLDDLQATCANVGAASLVVSWFGTDLRCGHCLVKPGVEETEKQTSPHAWSVAGLAREDAHLVSGTEGSRNYGGTPSDASVIRAIADLKARGLRVVFYPFILMDVPADNGLPDPYSDAGSQPAFPWRGRITCDPAPGRPGTPDKTGALDAEIDAFIGSPVPGPGEWSFRRMILHYAQLCATAGGVDAFLIGSELRGLTTLRNGVSGFPFVAALADLAGDVKAILPDAKISYAADWSEYFGHHPADGSGDRYFHLDALWSSPDIDFVGIDNYMPVTDWRDGTQHRDRLDGAASIYDRDYLASRMQGGEGYDWYYSSEADRDAQDRTAIADGAYGKPWVFRFKDVTAWWANAHYHRPGGVEDATPTDWVPESKPLWFTEVGCPALDKGTNEPNLFYDPKSSESAFPHYSSGARDDLIQARFVEVFDSYWGVEGAHNPVSSVYGGRMLDAANIFWWSWDARPFPAFPALGDVWADAPNYRLGHWLNGRADAVPLDALMSTVCADYGLTLTDASGLYGLVGGVLAEQPMPARDLIEPLARAFTFDAVESDGRIKFCMRDGPEVAALGEDDLAETGRDAALYTLTRAQETELPTALKLAYAEPALDYRSAAVESRRSFGDSRRETMIELPAAVAQESAQRSADILLQEIWTGRETVAFDLPPSRIAYEPGDRLTAMLGTRTISLRIEETGFALGSRVTARRHDAAAYRPANAPPRSLMLPAPAVFGVPAVSFLDLPLAGEGIRAEAPWIAAFARPWPGQLALLKREGPASFTLNRMIGARATMGTLLTALPVGPLGVFDRAVEIEVKLFAGALHTIDDAVLLAGGNAAAAGSEAEGWEILQFRDAELIAPDTYRLGWLLRGQSGSEPEMLSSRAAGSRFVLLDTAVVQPVVALNELETDITWRIGPAGRDHGDAAFAERVDRFNGLGLRPLSPVHLRAHRDGGDVVVSWIRRARIDGDAWAMRDVPLGEEQERYDLEILDAAVPVRGVTVSAPEYRYGAADIAADFGTPPADFTFRVYQVSTVFGRGAPLEATIHV
ncbi:glycoside hydrolase TIM-barrel-like domain-containing protein [soil metagenome]